jgi:hypothetical protein
LSTINQAYENSMLYQAEAPNFEWQKPDMAVLKGFQNETVAFPLEVLGATREWVSHAAEVKSAPVDYIAVGLLVICASLIGNSARVVPWSGWSEPAILNATLIGDPSSAKSPAMDAVLEPLKEIQKELQADFSGKQQDYETLIEVAKNERAAWEADVKEAVKLNQPHPQKPAEACDPERPTKARLLLGDATPEVVAILAKQNPRGLLMAPDELAGLLENMGRYNNSGDKNLWIEANGGRSYIVDRIKYLSDPILIPHLSISILGGIQPDRLASSLLSGPNDGFSARFLYCWPNKMPPKRPTVELDNGEILRVYRRLLSLEMDEEPQAIWLTPDAADLLQTFRIDLANMEDSVSGLLLSHIGKMPGLTLRIALILEMLWWAAGFEPKLPANVTKNAVAGAAMLLEDYFLPMAKRAFGDAALPESDKKTMALAKWIYKTKPLVINASQLRRNRIAGLTTAEAATSALIELMELGWIQPKPSRDGQNSGRQKSDYAVNPSIWWAIPNE